MRHLFLFFIGVLFFSCEKEDAKSGGPASDTAFVGEVVWVNSFGGRGEV